MANLIGTDGIGVIVEEVKSVVLVINAVDIDALCIIGKFERGPVNKPIEFYAWEDFVDTMGGFVSGSEAWLQAYVFFNLYNGRRLVCVRVVHLISGVPQGAKSAAVFDDKESYSGAVNEPLGYDGTETEVDIDGIGGDFLPVASPVGAYIEFTVSGGRITWTGKTYTIVGDTVELTGVVWITAPTPDVVDGEPAVYSELSVGATVRAKSVGKWGDEIAVEIKETSLVDSTLAVNLVTGVDRVKLTHVVNVVPGSVLDFDDGSAYAMVKEILSDNTVVFMAAIVFSGGPILALAPVVDLLNSVSVYFKGAPVDGEQDLIVSPWAQDVNRFADKVLKSSFMIDIVVDQTRNTILLNQQLLIATGAPVSLVGGNDGTAGMVDADYVGTRDTKTGLYALDLYKKPVVIAQPDATTATVQRASALYAWEWKIHMFVADFAYGLSVQAAKDYSDKSLALTGETATFCCWYWPNIKITNPLTLKEQLLHPSGSIVGAWARLSNLPENGPWNMAAGDPFGVLVGVVGMETQLSNGEEVFATDDDSVIASLQRSRINPIVFDDAIGYMLFGSLTLDRRKAEDDVDAFEHINQRNTFRLVEATLKLFFRRTLFKNNTAPTRDRVSTLVSRFLAGLFLLGAFPGAKPSDAFGVKCNASNNPDAVIRAGNLKCQVSLAKNTPINRVILEFSGQVQSATS